jgi:hypothetical protein
MSRHQNINADGICFQLCMFKAEQSCAAADTGKKAA